MWQKGLCKGEQAKGFEVGTLPWIVQVSPVQPKGPVGGKQAFKARAGDVIMGAGSSDGPRVQGEGSPLEAGSWKAQTLPQTLQKRPATNTLRSAP